MYLTRLMGYDYSIQYRLGKLNMVADALSRLPNPASSSLFLLLVPCFIIFQELKQHLLQDPAFIQLCQAILNTPTTYPDYSIARDLILKGGRIWLPQGSPFITTLLTKFHYSPTGNHIGVAKTLPRLSENFNWLGIRKDVEHFIVACVSCQHTKYETKKVVGLLCPLSVPFRLWEDL